MIYLCHKCAGHLTEERGPSIYSCQCISGYIRDWQSPTPVENIRGIQRQHCLDSLALYKSQGREPNNHHVRQAHARLERLNENN